VNRELHITASNSILNLELGKLGVEAELLHDAYLRDANRESSSLFAPITTILPEAEISAVVFGSRIRIMMAAKRYRATRIGVQQHAFAPVTTILPRGKDKGGCLWVANTHNDGCKMLSCNAHWRATTRKSNSSSTNLGVILCIPSVQ
jgi:hypothetical protein